MFCSKASKSRTRAGVISSLRFPPFPISPALGGRISIKYVKGHRQLLHITNYGTYNGVITSSTYGFPAQTTAAATGVPVEWRPRSLQFLARFEFSRCKLSASE